MIYTFPNSDILETLEKVTPEYMHPNRQPYAVISEAHLDSYICSAIVDSLVATEPHEFPGCTATTREYSIPLNPVLNPISQFCRETNDKFWKFDIDREPAAYMQTYCEGGEYPLHMDGNVGQIRKLSAIALLTNPNDYEGGDLVIFVPPHRVRVPNKQGTIIVFPHWLLHEVLTIESGFRQTINLGFWGPPFR